MFTISIGQVVISGIIKRLQITVVEPEEKEEDNVVREAGAGGDPFIALLLNLKKNRDSKKEKNIFFHSVNLFFRFRPASTARPKERPVRSM